MERLRPIGDLESANAGGDEGGTSGRAFSSKGAVSR